MNFFDHQRQAKKRSLLLVVYFTLALIALIVVLDVCALLLFNYFAGAPPLSISDADLTLFAVLNSAILITILTKALLQWLKLRKGHQGLANMLHAQRIYSDTTSEKERLLRNVAEEMAIAAGMAMPKLYLLPEESSINAFAAGHGPTDAAIFVTQGSLEQLSRDEMQALVGHELSHILNADTRINIRLLAILSGFLAVGKIGLFLLDIKSHSHRTSYRRRSNNRSSASAGAGAYVVIVALLLTAIGYIGLFLGRLIKAAICRQREHLADASSVQFTRNPDSLGTLFIKISEQSMPFMDTPNAEDLSHMCFAEPVKLRLQNLLATHPPITERLNTLGPRWQRESRKLLRRTKKQGARTTTAHQQHNENGTMGIASTPLAKAPLPSEQVGTVRPEDVAEATQQLDALGALRDAAHAPESAHHLLFALVLNDSQTDTVSLLQHAALPALPAAQLDEYRQAIQALRLDAQLALLEITLPTLAQQPLAKRLTLLSDLKKLVKADGKFAFFEWVVLAHCQQHLARNAKNPRVTQHHRYASVTAELQTLLSMMAWQHTHKADVAAQHFAHYARGLIPPARTMLTKDQLSYSKLWRAIERLNTLSPLLKAPLIDTLSDMTKEDSETQTGPTKGVLLRTVAMLLECPLPATFQAA